jgi:ferredoxin
MPPELQEFIAINAELAKSWKPISQSKEPPADADVWNGVPGKLGMLER